MPDALLDAIDWARMAEPQPDGYDTSVLLRLSADAGRPAGAIGEPRSSGTTPFGERGPVARPAPAGGLMSETIVPAPPDHPHLSAAARLLGRWPAGRAQVERLIGTIYPYTDVSQAAMGDWSLGSSSHSYEDQPSCIYATVDDPLGLAQALIHETAHQKLDILGVTTRAARRLILNAGDEAYAHPHASRPQPMPAVFHEQYTFIHVVALDLFMLAAADGNRERERILMLLARNVTRMEAGHDEVRRNIRTDDAGSAFVAAFLDWSTRVLRQGRDRLDAGGYGLSAVGATLE